MQRKIIGHLHRILIVLFSVKLSFIVDISFGQDIPIHLSESYGNPDYDGKIFPMTRKGFIGDPVNIGRGATLTCETGICIEKSACLGLGGSIKGFCMNEGSVCCNAYKKGCSHTTKEITSLFFSPEYPRPVVGTLICQYEVQIQAGICGVRLDFLEYNTTKPLDRGLCHIDQFLALNSLEGPSYPRCGDMTGYATIFPVDPTHKVPLTLLSIIQSAQETFKWNIKVTQMKCNHARKITDSPACDKKFTDEDPSLISPTILSEPSNSITDEEGRSDGKTTGKSSRQLDSLDNIFYIEYLKQTYQNIVDGPTNPNTVPCKNTPLLSSLLSANKTSVKHQHHSSPEERERIIRGTDALPYEFPFIVSIQDLRSHVCGGSIINEYFILTAAHCFMSTAPVPLSQIRIVVGDLNINITTETEHEFVEIHSLLFHSAFDPYYLKNDIALIRLRKPLKFRKGVQPICLPEEGNSYSGQNSTIAGWGSTHYPMGKLATHLQTSPNRIIENSECKKTLKIEYIYQTMMCAVSPECGGTCFGDSGGPLIVSSKEGKNRLAGIVSFGIGGCALFPYWPDVYTRVSEFIDWLSYATILY